MQVRDVMTTNVITVSPTTSISEVAKVLFDHRISAVPVVDAEGRPIGIVSEGDLLRRPEIGPALRPSWWLWSVFDPGSLAHEYAKSHGLRARDVMSRRVLTASEDMPLAEAAAELERNRIKRLPVVRDGRVVGIISRANIVQAIASTKAKAEAALESDRAIRDRLIGELRTQPWVLPHETNAIVRDGVVQLWGRVESEDARAAMRAAADRIPGVKAVEDHLVVMPIVPWD